MEQIYRHKFLVIDNQDILEINNLTRKVNQVVKHPEPVLKLDAPWDTEKSDAFNAVNVIFDENEKLFKMWYSVCGMIPGQYWEEGRKIAYATSKDGIHWEKPVMDMVEVRGSKKNNYIISGMLSVGSAVIIDPSDTASRRYKIIFTVESHESRWACFHSPLSLAYSSDGIHWERPAHVNPVIRGISDDVASFIYDPDRRKYQLYTRRVPNLPRDISLYESYDLVNWEDMGRVLVADEHDPPEMYNLHDMTPFFYEDFCLGLLGTMYFLPGMETASVLQKPPLGWPFEGIGIKDVQLAFSRDGREWHRPDDRAAVIPTGPPGAPDDGMIFPAHEAPVVVDGDTWIYYCACHWRHTSWSKQQYMSERGNDTRLMNCCMLAKMPEDHWVSLDAGNTEGYFLTKPWHYPGFQLLVNADAKGGFIEAELLTPYGEPVEGFTRRDCIPIMGNGKDQELKWKGASGWDNAQFLDFATKKYRGGLLAKFYLKNAKLYSYSVAELDPSGSIARYWANFRWCEIIKHRSDNWGQKSNEPAKGLLPHQR